MEESDMKAQTGNGDKATCPKPKLTVSEQIEHLKSKGVTFKRCSEDDAAEYLTKRNYYFRLAAYRTLFEKRVGGERDGQYIGLDFGDLVEFDNLDRKLRCLMFPMTTAIEHAAKTCVMARVTECLDEDGYTIMDDYWRSLSAESLSLRKREFSRLTGSEYSGAMMEKYPADIPVWLFLEFSSFGAFTNFYRFCALRWSDGDMLLCHYLLRQCVTLRNACGHDLPIVSGLSRKKGRLRVSDVVAQAVAETGISKKVRAAKLKNPRMQSVVSTVFLYTKVFNLRGSISGFTESYALFEKQAREIVENLPPNNASDIVRSSLGFLLTIFDKWL